ncbi:hypothetical protein EFL93_02875 [Weissella confusa]|uniref:hypothetical protein n=1 Tax=Weissella confusa TaxID=1583 RepID=UPI00107F32F2|nr:hypothetical protein [Weissella confusa]MBJ7635116.1 hypothetical protein [Weissella confusa]MBJ7655882.1 hypothetical protein [Weissella confusa]MCT0007359.1 hypothetical protein [Weissella confusa]TGE41281.1 hypothetical protein C6P25_08975 [Weissella confusa]TGE42391.1 hypothetical protein C6P26_08675 [Weissella confusa]
MNLSAFNADPNWQAITAAYLLALSFYLYTSSVNNKKSRFDGPVSEILLAVSVSFFLSALFTRF